MAVVLAAAAAGGTGAIVFGGGGSDRPPPAANAAAAGDVAVSPAAGSDALTADVIRTQAQLGQEPRNWLAWATLGADYVQIGRITADPSYYPKAQVALHRSLELDRGQNYLAMIGLASLAAARHDFHGALSWSQQAVTIDPQSASAYAVMTDALDELGRYPEAMRAIQRAVNLHPGVETFTRVSYVRELHGDVPGAVAAMQRAREDAFTPADIAFCEYYLGELAWSRGDLADALRHYRFGLTEDPSYALLYEGRAKVEAARGEVAAAVADYTTVVDRYPLPQYVIEFGDYLTFLGRHADAARQYGLVEIEYRLFRANGVDEDLDITLFQADHGQAAAAVAAGEAEWHRRHSIIVADALGWALHADGRNLEALRYARFATSLGYRNAMYYFHLGVIEAAVGSRSAARADLAAALRMNPYFSPLRAAQARRLLTGLGGGA